MVRTERVRDGRKRRLFAVVTAAAVMALVALFLIGLLVQRINQDAEIAAVTPDTTAPVRAEVTAPVRAEVTAPVRAEVTAPVPAEVTAPVPAEVAPDAGSAVVAVAPESPRSPESRRPRNARNTTPHTTEPGTRPTGPLAGSNEPGGQEPGGSDGKKPDGKLPGGKLPGAKEPFPADAASDLEALYKRVGEKLNAFERERGAAAARPLWDAYSAIPLLDAMRTPSLGQDAMRTLRRIERDMAAARPTP